MGLVFEMLELLDFYFSIQTLNAIFGFWFDSYISTQLKTTIKYPNGSSPCTTLPAPFGKQNWMITQHLARTALCTDGTVAIRADIRVSMGNEGRPAAIAEVVPRRGPCVNRRCHIGCCRVDEHHDESCGHGCKAFDGLFGWVVMGGCEMGVELQRKRRNIYIVLIMALFK